MKHVEVENDCGRYKSLLGRERKQAGAELGQAQTRLSNWATALPFTCYIYDIDYIMLCSVHTFRVFSFQVIFLSLGEGGGRQEDNLGCKKKLL